MAGRKNKYEEQVKPFLAEINRKIREGITEAKIAEALGISVATLNNYKNQHPELIEALSKNKGADVLESLVNSGIEAAKGYYRENEVTVIIPGDDGKPEVKQKTISKQWYPPNQTLNIFYVQNFGKEQGFVKDPLEYEIKKAKQEFDETLAKEKNWDIELP